MKYDEKIFQHFQKTYEKDKDKHIKEWITSWEYQDRRKKRQQKYPNGFPTDFYRYNEPSELIKWFDWSTAQMLPDYFTEPEILPLIDMSRKHDFELLKKFSLVYDRQKYDKYIGRYNAQDYLFQNIYPVPKRYQIKRILDFGAGYGRQSNIWSQKRTNLIYVGMDAIPLPYCLQHLYYSHLNLPFYDYVLDPSVFEINEKPGVYHLPTWRYDLLPESFFDMIICVQVLQELNKKLVCHMLEIFNKVLKPGGGLYIRDHDQAWTPAHKIVLNKYLPKKGFTLEFRPHVRDKIDIHGVPRIWRTSLSGVYK